MSYLYNVFRIGCSFSYMISQLAAVALQALKAYLNSTPPNWVGSDPCGVEWDGIECTNSRVTSM